MRASSLYYAGLRALGLPRAVRDLRNRAVVLCYHNVVPDELGEWGGPGAHIAQSRFRDQMRWLASHYTVLPLRALLARMRAGRSLRKTAAVTFDDAYRGVFENAQPVLAEFGLPATVFVVSNAPAGADLFWWDHPEAVRQIGHPSSQRWLRELRGDGAAILRDLGATSLAAIPGAARPAGWGLIRAAARAGLDLGVHSATHRALPTLSDTELLAEVVASRETLARHSDVTTPWFAYPYGAWDTRVRNTVRAAGYDMAFTLTPRLIAADDDPWALPRVNIPAQIPPAAFQAWTAGLCPRGAPPP